MELWVLHRRGQVSRPERSPIAYSAIFNRRSQLSFPALFSIVSLGCLPHLRMHALMMKTVPTDARTHTEDMRSGMAPMSYTIVSDLSMMASSNRAVCNEKKRLRMAE